MYKFKSNTTDEVFEGTIKNVRFNNQGVLLEINAPDLGCTVTGYLHRFEGFSIVDYFKATFNMDARFIGGDNDEMWDFHFTARHIYLSTINKILTAFKPFIANGVMLNPVIGKNTWHSGVLVNFPVTFKTEVMG